MLGVREFDDLPDGWVVQEQSHDNVHFHRADREIHVRLLRDDDHHFWVMMWAEQPDELLFQQQVLSVGDAIRTGHRMMGLYNTVWDHTVRKIMDDVSLVVTLTETMQDNGDRKEDDQEATDELVDRIDAALHEGDYQKIQHITETATAIMRDHCESA